jgi:DNA-binding Lrp family transcriptional regulator
VTADGFSERDIELIHVLQIAPRISWAAAARALGTTAPTLAARWADLQAAGRAWIAVHPGGSYREHVTALVEVGCRGDERSSTVERLCVDPRVITVEESTQGYDLLLTVMTANLRDLSDFIIDGLDALPGVSSRRTFIATSVHRDGSSWRFDALTPAQVRAVERSSVTMSTSRSLPSDIWPLVDALAHDGRQSASDLAAVTGRNPATVRRQLPRLLASGLVSIRCEVSQDDSHHAVSCTWRARVPASALEESVAAIRTLPNVRLCMSTTGETNLLVTAWATDLAHLVELERLFTLRAPSLVLRDSSVNLRTLKRVGWRLDHEGRRTGELIVPTALKER